MANKTKKEALRYAEEFIKEGYGQKRFVRIKCNNGVIILTREEYLQGLDRENEGVIGQVIEDKNCEIGELLF